MDREQKKVFVEQFNEQLNQAEFVALVHYHGLTVSDLAHLRSQLKQEEVNFKVVKNTLFKLAAKGTPYEKLVEDYSAGAKQAPTGPTAVVLGNDPVSPSKALVEFSKKKKELKLVGGAIKEQVLDDKAVEQLAKLPSLEGVRAQLLGVLTAPAGKIAQVVNQVPTGIVRVVNEYYKQEG